MQIPAVSQVPVPKQARSRQTLERLLDAAEKVFARKSFEQATVSEIAAEAGFTVGAFYARFPSKDALLEALTDRTRKRYGDALAGVETIGATSLPLGRFLDELVDAFVRSYEEKGWFARITAIRTDPTLRGEVDAMNAMLVTRLSELLLDRRAEIGHPKPDAAVEFCLLMISTSLREIVVLREFWPKATTAAARKRSIAELKTALRAYLQVQTG